jgi:diguanylate cyclase (GGDEF)-like protein/PAS domain S-box-containing protein
MQSIELLSNIALTFVGGDNFDNKIKSALNTIGVHTGISRIHIFLDSSDGSTSSNVCEWCNEAITPVRDKLQNIQLDTLFCLKNILLREGRICADNIQELPEDITALLEPQGITSTVIFPLLINREMAGFISFDQCANPRAWTAENLKLLKTVTGMLSSAYELRLYREQLESAIHNFEAFFRTIDELIIICHKDGNILYTNDAVRAGLGYSSEELLEMNILDLSPKEIREETAEIVRDIIDKKKDFGLLQLESRDHNRIPVEMRLWPGSWNNQECIFSLSRDKRTEPETLLKFTRLFEDNPVLMAITDLPERNFLDVNTAFLEKTGYSRDEVIGRTADQLDLFSLSDEEIVLAGKLVKSGKFKNIEMNIRCKNGKILNGLFSGEVIGNHSKKYLLTVMVDITEQIILRKRLENKRNRLNNIIESAGLGSWEWNIQTGEVIINDRWAEMLGYTIDDLSPLTAETWEKLVHPDDRARAYELLRSHFSRETAYYDCETRMKHKNGEWIWISSKGKVIEWDSSGKPLTMFGTHSDITENRIMQEQIRELSIRDFLTGVYNRRHMFERLETILAEYRREKNCFTVSIIDIDYFKNINDNFGHLAGDFVLKEFAQIIQNHLRPYDLIGRYGGEEFIVVSMNVDSEQTRLTMERILHIVRDTTFVYRAAEIRLAFSCGISESLEYDAENISAEKLLDKADTRLYKAKRAGRNMVVIRD